VAEAILTRRGVFLTREDLPPSPTGNGDVSSVFNPGAIRWQGMDRFLLRVQSRSRETYLYTASRSDSGQVDVASRPLELTGLEDVAHGLTIYHIYDPRLTEIEGTVVAMLAVDTSEGCRLLTLRTDDFAEWKTVAMDRSGDRRNGVLFPRRVDGEYLRLERPNHDVASGQPRSGSTVVLSTSPDLETWKEVGPVFSGRPHFWDELVGPGPPPILTEEGWLLIYHGVATHFAAAQVYQAGAILLDRNDPTKVLGRTRENILEPRELYETTGQVPNVVFPSGWIPQVMAGRDVNSFHSSTVEVDVYYGAADTCVAWASTTVGRMLGALANPLALS